MKTLTDKAKRFLSQQPELMGIVLGYRFYEHPVYGDESPLIVITPEGKKKLSGFYDYVPDMDELLSAIEMGTL